MLLSYCLETLAWAVGAGFQYCLLILLVGSFFLTNKLYIKLLGFDSHRIAV